MLEAIGLDIGSTRTKLVDCGNEGRDYVRFDLYDPDEERPFTPEMADEMARCIRNLGYRRIGVTGAGATTFAGAAKKFLHVTVVMSEGDPLTREIAMQTAGIKSLCRRQGEPLPNEFTLVTIGTGVSYTLASLYGQRVFPIGNPIGGGFITGVTGLTPDFIADFGKTHSHGDLLMKDRFPEKAGQLVGEFVLASYGDMGRESIIKPASTAAKCVATQVIRDLMVMGMIPDWKPSWPVVFAGTPVDRYELLRGWLTEYCESIGLPHRYVSDSAHAGALGAYELACAKNP